MKKCCKCNGEGYIKEYINYNDGICYDCNGTGAIFDENEISHEKLKTLIQESEEFHEHKVNHPDYFTITNYEFSCMTDSERVSYLDNAKNYSEMCKEQLNDMLIDCGYDSYDDYKKDMKEQLEIIEMYDDWY